MYNRSNVLKHLKANDPKLMPVLGFIRHESITPSRTPFMDLAEAIINQQLSEKAGRTIFTRFRALFPNKRVTPALLLRMPDQELRSAGISGAKAIYLKSLAVAVSEKTLVLGTLTQKTDEEVISSLTAVKGIGRWTAEMFLMFTLGREDIFSYGDLGLRRAIQLVYGLRKEPTLKQMETLSGKWKPYRTYVALALWNFKDR
jgi:DNA-3-methyladenine glycosylase II